MRSHHPTRGFTMVELVVAIAVAVIVTAGIYALYTNYVRAFIGQDRVIETQQAARVAVDTLTQDLLRAGYRVAGTTPVVAYAAADRIRLEYFNDDVNQFERVEYLVVSNNLVRRIYRQNAGTWPGIIQNDQSGVLAENVVFADVNGNGVQDAGEAPALQFTYFDTDGLGEADEVTPPGEMDVSTPKDADSGNAATVEQLRKIRQVRVVVTVRSDGRDPVTGRYIYRTLRADVKPRNAGLMSTTRDTNPPATPTGFKSNDPGDCGFLHLSWDSNNTEPDLAGYIIYWGTMPGEYLNSVTVGASVPHSPGTPYVLGNLNNAVQYYMAIAAYDQSGNTSALSPELTGNVPDSDTTPEVGDPDTAPANLVATGQATQITVAFDSVPESDIAGYRVYRKYSPFSSTDLAAIKAGTPGPDVTVVADEYMFGIGSTSIHPRVTQTTTGYRVRDTQADLQLKACSETYYAVTAIKGCGHPISGYSDALFARTGPAEATDTTPPDPATLAAYPSYLRNYLNVTSPTNLDFVFTAIAYRTDGSYPSFSVDADTGAIQTNGTFVECYPTSYGEGTFTGAGTTGILHRGLPCAGGYHLDPSVTYYYTAVAVDTCNNLSNYATTSSQVAATQCSDETEGPGIGNPPKVTTVRGNTIPTVGVSTSEATLDWDPVDDSFTAIRDLAGYYVFRTAGADTTTPVPTLSNIDDAKGLLLTPTVTYTGLTEGRVNRVRILAVDCETVTKDTPSHAFLSGRYSAAEFNNRASDTLIFYPGRVGLDTSVGTRAFGKHYASVEFRTVNSINAAATAPGNVVEFKTLTFDWTTPNSGGGGSVEMRLAKVSIDADGNGSIDYTITPGSPVTSGTALPASSASPSVAGFKASANTRFRLDFINASTGSTAKADMRNLRIDTRLVWVPVTRRSSDTATPFVHSAAQEASITFTVPSSRGPSLSSPLDANYFSDWWNTAVEYGQTKILGSGDQTGLNPSNPYPYPSSETVDVAAFVTDNAGSGIERVRVFYTSTDTTVTSPPDIGVDFPASSTYSVVTLCDRDGSTPGDDCTALPPGGGTGTYDNSDRGLIPAHPGRRVWYVIVAEDRGGNYGALPSQVTGPTRAFYYDHR